MTKKQLTPRAGVALHAFGASFAMTLAILGTSVFVTASNHQDPSIICLFLLFSFSSGCWCYGEYLDFKEHSGFRMSNIVRNLCRK